MYVFSLLAFMLALCIARALTTKKGTTKERQVTFALLMVDLVLVLFSIFGFIHKIYNVAKIYRLKYQLLLFVLGFVICGYAVNFILDTVIDITAITCALGGIVIYFFAVEYISNALLLRMLSVVSQEMTDAVFIFNSIDRCIYENDSARKMLQKYGHACDDVKRLLMKVNNRKALQDISDFSLEYTLESEETVEQVDFLLSIGCDMFQGYYFAKPMKLERFEELYLDTARM